MSHRYTKAESQIIRVLLKNMGKEYTEDDICHFCYLGKKELGGFKANMKRTKKTKRV